MVTIVVDAVSYPIGTWARGTLIRRWAAAGGDRAGRSTNVFTVVDGVRFSWIAQSRRPSRTRAASLRVAVHGLQFYSGKYWLMNDGAGSRCSPASTRWPVEHQLTSHATASPAANSHHRRRRSRPPRYRHRQPPPPPPEAPPPPSPETTAATLQLFLLLWQRGWLHTRAVGAVDGNCRWHGAGALAARLTPAKLPLVAHPRDARQTRIRR